MTHFGDPGVVSCRQRVHQATDLRLKYEHYGPGDGDVCKVGPPTDTEHHRSGLVCHTAKSFSGLLRRTE